MAASITPWIRRRLLWLRLRKSGFLDAVLKAKPVVQEPSVQNDVLASQENMGDIDGDPPSKRGRISATTALPSGLVSVSGQVPQSELESYQSELKSLIGGVGTYTIELSQ